MVTDSTLDVVDRKRTEIADRDTPLIRNEWYVAALASEVTRTPLRRTILEQDILLYRLLDGSVAAVQNRCPHRSFPLSEGRVEGDRIVCGYHGFQFDPDGRCALVPSLQRAPSAIRIQSYPVREIGPFIWIWTGDAAAADHGKLIEQPWFTEPGWTWVSGSFSMRANYLGLHENLFDLTHFPFLHGAAVGKPEHAEAKPTVEVLENGVRASVLLRDSPVSPALERAAGLKRPVDQQTDQFVSSPGMHIGGTFWTDSSDPPVTFRRQIIHCMTPETQRTTLYFWGVSRNIAIDDPDVDAEAFRNADRAFREDKAALEAIEELMERDHRPGFRETIIATDAAGIHVLRFFARRAAADAQSSMTGQSQTC